MSQPMLTGRWVVTMPGRYEPGRNCAYCRTHYNNGACTPVACLLCRTVQCSGNGSGNGCCRLCSHGYLPGWSRTARQADCGYARCNEPAVAWVRRGKTGCTGHAMAILAGYVTEQIAWRDAGRSHMIRWAWRDYGVLAGNQVPPSYLLSQTPAEGEEQNLMTSAKTLNDCITAFLASVGRHRDPGRARR